MNVATMLANIPYEVVFDADVAVTGIAHDSRKVQPGDAFVCIRGLELDGHKYMADAARKGAVLFLIDRDQPEYPTGCTVVKVRNTRRSLSELAANFYGKPAESLRLFGVTGTNGKTTVTYMMEALLRQLHTPDQIGVIGTIGARLGDKKIDIPYDTSTTPDAPELQHMFHTLKTNGARDVAMEVSSHSLALYKTEGLLFDAAMFTNLTQDHLDFHGTMENYFSAKAKLFTQCRIGVVNVDDRYAVQLMETGTCQWLTYGIMKECDLRAVHIRPTADGTVFSVALNGTAREMVGCDTIENILLPVQGRFNIYNALAVVGASLVAGLTPAQLCAGFANYKGVPGRIQSVPNTRGVHVLVDYAHTPDGLANIINAVRGFTEGRLITMFGCGGDRDATKRPKMGNIACELSDYCLITSDNPRREDPDAIIAQIVEGITDTGCPYECVTDRRDAIFRGVAMLQPGDSLIVAGKGHENTQTVGTEEFPFDDFSVAAEALSEESRGEPPVC